MNKKLYLCLMLSLNAINYGQIVKMTTQDQNELAEESFLKWKINEKNKLNINLNDSIIHCISINSQETIGQTIINSNVKAKQVINSCVFDDNLDNNAEILKLINKVIEPDVDLIQWLERKNTSLSTLMNFLGNYHTATHKNKLNAWAFYFLTSQATNIALSFIKNEESKTNKKFDVMDLKIKEKILAQATPIIAKNFIKSVKLVAQKFKLTIPKTNISDIEPIIFDYLKEKFI